MDNERLVNTLIMLRVMLYIPDPDDTMSIMDRAKSELFDSLLHQLRDAGLKVNPYLVWRGDGQIKASDIKGLIVNMSNADTISREDHDAEPYPDYYPEDGR